MGSLKGKTTSHKAELEEVMPVVDRQFLNQIMYIDLMFVNSIPYLVSVTNPVSCHGLARSREDISWIAK